MQKIKTGIKGLDRILKGGLIPGRVYVVTGGPGCGKTILALHFLAEGVKNGERVLFITLSESTENIKLNAKSIGINLEGIHFLDLTPSPKLLSFGYVPSSEEVEMDSLKRQTLECFNKIKPTRIVVDSVALLRYLSPNMYQYRIEVLEILKYITKSDATVLLTSESGVEVLDEDIQFVADGVISIERDEFGDFRISVKKYRGSDFIKGAHFMKITNKGLKVYPVLTPKEFSSDFKAERIPSGVPELDKMLNGGIPRGSVTLIIGPAGIGKTTLGLHFLITAAHRGENSALYAFDEDINSILKRCDGINLPAREMVKKGFLFIKAIEPLEYRSEEIINLILKDIKQNNIKFAMIDSLAGYMLSVRGEALTSNLHRICKILTNLGVTVILTDEIEEISGEIITTRVNFGHLVDNIIFMHYFMEEGVIKRAIGILKMRFSNFEKDMREFKISTQGFVVCGKTLKFHAWACPPPRK